MTGAASLLEQLAQVGVSVTVDGSELVLVPGDRVPAEMVSTLREHKADIMALLCPGHYIEAQAAALLTCPACGANEWWPRRDGVWTCGRCHPEPPGGSLRMKGFPGR